MISIQVLLLATCCLEQNKADFSDDTEGGGLLSLVYEFDTFLNNLVECRNTHLDCLKDGDKICEEWFSRCVGKYPMVSTSTMKSLGTDNDQSSYGIIPNKWKNAITKAKNAIKDFVGKGKDKIGNLIEKGKVKIKNIIQKIKIKIPDIIETLKALPETMEKVPSQLKSLLQKIKAIPSIVYKNVKKAVEHCQERRIDCIFGNSTAAKLACDLKYPVCVPTRLSCNVIAGNVIKMCERVLDAVEEKFGIPHYCAGDLIEMMICMFTWMPIRIIATMICAGPSVIASGCILTA